jgi:hypothetical protein
MPKLPHQEWNFNAKAEETFNKWFHDNYGPFSVRSEYYYSDCEVEDSKTLQDLMYKWIHVAFVTGYEYGKSDGCT